ncbi:MAG: Ig-like domain-containing protein, partial [Clostridia bacterium]|nr:Ig-like domain-containing protein [Clostridia bacterium]
MKLLRLTQKIISLVLSVAFVTAVCACRPNGGINSSLSGRLTLSDDEKTLAVGEVFTLTASVDVGQTITFVSTNERVATVTDSGLVTAINKGYADILVVAGALTGTCRVTVNAFINEDKLPLSTTKVTVRQGESA